MASGCGWTVDGNEGNRAANGRGRSPSPRFVGKAIYVSVARTSQGFDADLLAGLALIFIYGNQEALQAVTSEKAFLAFLAFMKS